MVGQPLRYYFAPTRNPSNTMPFRTSPDPIPPHSGSLSGHPRPWCKCNGVMHQWDRARESLNLFVGVTWCVGPSNTCPQTPPDPIPGHLLGPLFGPLRTSSDQVFSTSGSVVLGLCGVRCHGVCVNGSHSDTKWDNMV